MRESQDSSNFDTIVLGPGVRAFPVVHGSVEYTVALRSLLLEQPPAVLALELPGELSAAITRALPHADAIPVITYPLPNDDQRFHFILEPLEPIVEAVRSGYEADIPLHFVDRMDGRAAAWVPEMFPDTYALRYMSPVQLYEHYRDRQEDGVPAALRAFVRSVDHVREVHMAARLRQLSAFVAPSGTLNESVLFVCGVRHVEAVRALLALDEDAFSATQARAAEDARERFAHEPAADPADMEPLEALLGQTEQSNADTGASISVLSRKTPEVLEQPGYYNAAWNLARANPAIVPAFNRITLQRSAYRECVNRYERDSGELVPPQREKFFFRFARNWSIVERRLLPDLYRMVISARGFGNDNFARIMHETLSYLPPADHAPFPEEPLTLDDMHRDSRLIRFRMKYKIKRKVAPPKLLRRFKREKYPGEWRDAWDGTGICSYPPEDIRIEDFGRYLQERARSVMQGGETKTVPFTSSLLDGIDYRETIRNLHLGKIFVKDTNIRGLQVGSVVVIFSHDEAVYDWRVVWWGEHDQESDMALYATQPGAEMVGPGITRCRYGGFMLTYPPGRLHDIWTDDFYKEFPKPADRLLASAIEYNEQTAVVHLSDQAPNPKLTALAGRMGQKIIHIPLSTINAVMLGRIQRFHVLDSRDRRDSAEDFIW